MKPIWQDGQGYIYYGEGDEAVQIEHYSDRLEYVDAVRLRDIIKNLERLSVPVSSRTVVWYKDWFPKYVDPGSPYLWLLKNPCDIYEKDNVLLFVAGREPLDEQSSLIHFKTWNGEKFGRLVLIEKWDENFHHTLDDLGYEIANAGQSEGLGICYAIYRGMVDLFTKHNIPEEEP